MDVAQAIKSRQSCRQFSDKPVSLELVRKVLETARWSPSGSNVQPWHIDVMTGGVLQGLVDRVMAQDHLFPFGEGTEYPIHPPKMKEPYMTRRTECAADMYASVNITREDRDARIGQYAKNLEFFGAPVGFMFSIDRTMGQGHWADMGMLLQTIMLVARSEGLHTCPQQVWAMWHKTVTEYLKIPDSRMIFCGMGLGYMDEKHPINNWRTTRQEIDDFTSFSGFE
ncbi:MAG: nitroreductase [Alphaproteobacteria bacterium]|jgi:nitroreductase|nr:nitroreductase [Alphaproteobacteria bacterium]MBT4019078.1 nitroreductase [Alphaproteobacteria bacterium]MBT4966469.1 nitroreductase [Alphaproteobacteria bacterium]MBT5159096.1 nitroreductase [Alphaproteobacteria bacterium]MBT5918832.1 nitroreductase [Alphaproteobacteria bacterium]